jgi:hypothetical protein
MLSPIIVADLDPFDTDPDPVFHFDTDPDPASQSNTDPDPYRFKEVMYLKQYFLIFIHLYFSFLVSRSNRTHTKGILFSILPSS